MYMFNQAPVTSGHCDAARFDGEAVFSRTTRWLQHHARAPFFLFVHTYEPHDRCPFLRGKGDLFGWGFEGAEGRRKALDYYDGLVAKTDELMGALLREIDRLGLTNTTLIAVTSDHGEGFAEHGIIGHGSPVKPYEEIARVPLILRYPGVLKAGERVATPVSAIDLAPSILALLKIPTKARTDGGLLPGISEAAAAKPVFVQSDDILAVRNARHKLITTRTGTFADEVYDLQEDPAEKKNIAASDAAVTAALKRQAADYWERASPGSGKPPALDHLDSETKEDVNACLVSLEPITTG
jgi:arylsulfatase A-like enzyme